MFYCVSILLCGCQTFLNIAFTVTESSSSIFGLTWCDRYRPTNRNRNSSSSTAEAKHFSLSRTKSRIPPTAQQCQHSVKSASLSKSIIKSMLGSSNVRGKPALRYSDIPRCSRSTDTKNCVCIEEETADSPPCFTFSVTNRNKEVLHVS